MLHPTLDDLARIEPYCEAFEQDWLAGNFVRLEDLIPADWTREDRQLLFHHLLELEFDYRRKAGHSPSRDDYLRRFPEFAEIIDGVASNEASTGIPKSIGSYEVFDRIGRGGMGVIYKGFHPKLKRTVAIKVLAPDCIGNSTACDRFEVEMEAIGRLEHPNVIRALDAGEHDGHFFLVMEFVDGQDLAAVLRRHGSLRVADACELVRQAALGLQEVHEHRLVHRDIKPSNLLLTRKGQIKVVDLGLALLAEMHRTKDSGLTTNGAVLGTLDYIAPEQCDNCHAVDIRADIYSLGATLYGLLAGEPPLSLAQLDTPLKKLTAIATAVPAPLSDLRRDVSSGLSEIIQRMLSKEPTNRPATPLDVAQALASYCHGARLECLLRDPTESVAEADDSPPTPTVVQKECGVETQRNPSAAASMALKASNGGLKSRFVGVSGGWFAMAAAILALAGVVLFLPVGEGTLRIEILDPAATVRIHGTEILLKGGDERQDIKVTPGAKTLRVNRGDLSFDTSAFTLQRGETVALKVELLAEKLRVVDSQGRSLGEQFVAARAEPPISLLALKNEIRERFVLHLDDELGAVVDKFSLPNDATFTIEAWFLDQCDTEIATKPTILGRASHFNLDVCADRAMFYSFHVDVEGRVKPGGWMHIAGVRTATDRRLFIDGKLIAKKNDAATNPELTTNPLHIGMADFRGHVCEIRISTSARYRDDFSPQYPHSADRDTIALYRCDEGSGELLRDSSASRYDGKIRGATWVRLP